MGPTAVSMGVFSGNWTPSTAGGACTDSLPHTPARAHKCTPTPNRRTSTCSFPHLSPPSAPPSFSASFSTTSLVVGEGAPEEGEEACAVCVKSHPMACFNTSVSGFSWKMGGETWPWSALPEVLLSSTGPGVGVLSGVGVGVGAGLGVGLSVGVGGASCWLTGLEAAAATGAVSWAFWRCRRSRRRRAVLFASIVVGCEVFHTIGGQL